MNRTFAFIFLCQQGELEIKSALLAASLRRHLRCDYELIVAVPGPAAQWGTPGMVTREFLTGLGVRWVQTENKIDPAYPIGNKIDCLRVATSADKFVFLDSDVILMRDFEDQARFGIAFNARPASYPTFSNKDADWEPVYRACGVAMPTTRIRTTHSGDYILPYFNSGFVAIPGKSGFGDAWMECCRIIDALEGVPNKRPYVDQIALGVAAAKLGLEMDCLDERYNHPINFKPLNERDLPYFCHYHDPRTLRREPAALMAVESLLAEHGQLRTILESNPEWAKVARSSRAARRAVITPELIITGIPRSGTSYLCNMLHRLDNCVVLNEPAEVPRAMMELCKPYGVGRFFRDMRRDIVEGVPVNNRLVDGKVTEDTAVINEVHSYIPKVETVDFVLGVKANLPFLTRLPWLRQVMPNARFVACVRNPVDAIASWKGSFETLKFARVDAVNVGRSTDPWLTGMQRNQLQAISVIADDASRRAAWWAYLAGLVLNSISALILVRYDEMVLRPAEVLGRILDGWPGGNPREAIEPSRVRSKREGLDAADMAAIRALCREPAEALGLSID